MRGDDDRSRLERFYAELEEAFDQFNLDLPSLIVGALLASLCWLVALLFMPIVRVP